MADPLVAPDVVRYTINGTYLGRPVANILDMVVLDTVGPVTERDEAVDEVAGDIIDAWDTHVLSWVNTSYTAISVSWVDLNTATSTTGSRSSTDDTSWPADGRSDGDPYAASVAALVTKQTSSARGSRNGRMFIAGVDESFISGNLIDAPIATGIQTELNGLLEELTETGVVSDYQYFPTVVHTRNEGTASNPEIVYVNNTQVTRFNLERQVASQRRRNRP